MTLDELLNQLTSLGVMAVEVSDLELENIEITIDQTSLATAVTALHILGPVVCFYHPVHITDGWFIHTHEAFSVPYDLELPPGLLEKHYKPQVDLRTLSPALRAMKNKFKEPLFIEVLLVSGSVKMALSLDAPWSETYHAAHAEAIALADSQHEEREALFDLKVEELQEGAQEQQRKAQQELETPHLQAFRALLQDPGFVKLASVKSTTLKALLVYVREPLHEAIEVLGENRSKEMLSDLALEVQVGKYRTGAQHPNSSL